MIANSLSQLNSEVHVKQAWRVGLSRTGRQKLDVTLDKVHVQQYGADIPWKRIAANRGGRAPSAANGQLKNSDGLVLGRRTISPRLGNRA